MTTIITNIEFQYLIGVLSLVISVRPLREPFFKKKNNKVIKPVIANERPTISILSICTVVFFPNVWN